MKNVFKFKNIFDNENLFLEMSPSRLRVEISASLMNQNFHSLTRCSEKRMDWCVCACVRVHVWGELVTVCRYVCVCVCVCARERERERDWMRVWWKERERVIVWEIKSILCTRTATVCVKDVRARVLSSNLVDLGNYLWRENLKLVLNIFLKLYLSRSCLF